MFFLKPLLVLAFLFATSEAQRRQSNITQGRFLTPEQNSTWLSDSGLYAFGFYREGNGFSVGIFMAGIPQKTVVWTANRDSPPVSGNATLRFTSEGRLVLLSTQGEDNVGDPIKTASSASMLDSGNFVLYNSSGDVIWQSFEHPTDTLLPSQRLLMNNELVSSASEENHASGIFRLKMQEDGNLVQYPVNTPDTATYAYYSSGTYGRGSNITLVFDEDASLYLVNSTGVNIKNITDRLDPTKDRRTYRLKIDPDGIFRLYSYRLRQNDSWSIEWESTGDKCNPKGLCGLNSFCILNDQKADCKCLPGFDFVEKGNQTAGCERNFTADSCGNKTKSPAEVGYNMEELPSTIWENMQYEVISLDDKDGCIQACLDDCNCEAALYDGRQCRKQRLPLRYGRRWMGDSYVALIKVYTSKQPKETGVLRRESSQKIRKDVLIIGVILVFVGFVMLAVSVAVLSKSRWSNKRIARLGDVELIGEEVSLRSFTFRELQEITSGFKEEIGKGSFGTVYKGRILSSQKEVAVKRLEKVLKEGEIEFRNEMKAIGRTHHKNLVRLLGYCHEGSNRLLVYQYMSNGSLSDVLFDPENQPCWEERLEIASGVARGILYLHEECESQIIHCDIKPQNILMDEDRCAKISDFGLAKLLKPDQTRTYTGIRGTRGYVAPEWYRKLPITAKADVYSFGIVLLEIICCRKSVNWELPEEEAVLEEWAYDCFEKGELMKLVEREEMDKRQLERVVKVALWCIQEEPSMRPSMKKVLLMLEGTVDIPIPPSPEFFSA